MSKYAKIIPKLIWWEVQQTNGYATYQDMYEHNLYSLRYLCTFSHSKNNSKFTGSLLKIYVCDVNKTLLSMKVKYVYVIQNRKYTGGLEPEQPLITTPVLDKCARSIMGRACLLIKTIGKKEKKCI
jgi:hypothetical protein